MDDFRAQDRVAEISLNSEHYFEAITEVNEVLFNHEIYADLISQEVRGIEGEPI